MQRHASISTRIGDYAQHVVRSCDLDSASIFLCDRVTGQPQISYLFNTGVPTEVTHVYCDKAVFLDDPFTDPRLQEQPDQMENDGVLQSADRRITTIARPSGRYWQFMRHYGIDVIGASTRRLLPGIYATIGFHRTGAGSKRNPVSLAMLDDLAPRLQDLIARQLLGDMLGQPGGLQSFRAQFFKRPEPAIAQRLSPREKDIADLVCKGRLNKEIAFEIGLSEHTVENHLRRIYAKLSIHNRASLVALMQS